MEDPRDLVVYAGQEELGAIDEGVEDLGLVETRLAPDQVLQLGWEIGKEEEVSEGETGDIGTGWNGGAGGGSSFSCGCDWDERHLDGRFVMR